MKAVFCGSFDPVTLGHIDLIERASRLYEKVGVFVSENSLKHSLFSNEEKVKWIERSVSHLDNVEVFLHKGLAVDACKAYGAKVLIRGIRNGIDMDYESNMAFMNQQIDPDIETVCLFANPALAFISSSNVRELLRYHLSLQGFVPASIMEEVVQAANRTFHTD